MQREALPTSPRDATPVVWFLAAPGKPSIAHRDVKSRNVLLEWERVPSGNAGSAPLLRAKLADFGLALAFDRPAAVLARSQPQVRAVFHFSEIGEEVFAMRRRVRWIRVYECACGSACFSTPRPHLQ